MSLEINKTKVSIQNIIDAQIPSFLNEDSPLFSEFLNQYYLSQEYPTGSMNLADNLTDLKNIETYNNELFFTAFVPSKLTSNLSAFSTTINVSHTIGFPERYGLLRIGNEIITYRSKTSNSFVDCSRGFSGVTDVSNPILTFTKTVSEGNELDTEVQNLNLVFYQFLFTKFKAQFLPGFENRQFVPEIKIKNILSRAVDFYTSKGTEVSYQLLFNVLYNKKVSMIRPQEFILRPSDDNYFITNNILLEKVSGGDPFSIEGKTLFQNVSDSTEASASVYSIEYRPVNGKDFYEVYLDSTSLTFSFLSTNKTNISKDELSNGDSLFVDSTIGFPKQGTVLLKGKNTSNTFIELSYSGKTNTQFLNVTGLTVDVEYGDEILESNFAYSYDDDNNEIRFRIVSVIGEVDYAESSNLLVNDTISLSSFGAELGDKPEFNTWVYNIPSEHDIKEINLSADVSGNIYNITFYESINFYLDQSLNFSNPDDPDDIVLYGYVNKILEDDKVEVFSNQNILSKKLVKKEINLGTSENDRIKSIKNIPVCIQNTYIDTENEYYYVAASGIPQYQIHSEVPEVFVSASVVSGGSTDILDTNRVHKFYTGEKIFYSGNSNSGISSGVYHITCVGSNLDSTKVRLSLSKSDLFSKKYVSTDVNITSDKFVKLDFENKEILNQKILKKFNLNKSSDSLKEIATRSTNNKTIGMMVNGVELYSPTLFDENIYYGQLNSIEITNSGSGYDIINPPELMIFDTAGIGATAYVNIEGQLDDVIISSPGLGYQTKPKITIVGGNGTGAAVEPNLVKRAISATFRGDGIGFNSVDDTITFQTKHNFDPGEEILYTPNSNPECLPLKANSTYFPGIIDDFTIKLYESEIDALKQENQINLQGISSGTHTFTTLKVRNTITKIYVKNQGSGYSNRSIKIPSVLAFDGKTNGFNTFDDYIFAKKHGFKDRDLILYSTTGVNVGGLSTETQYVVTVIDEDIFKLSSTISGVNTTGYSSASETLKFENYNNRVYVGLSSIGSGLHELKYPPIRVEVESLSGIGLTVIAPVFEPVVTGSIESVFLEDAGVGYGVSDILNFHRRPDIQIKDIESTALIRPIVVSGSIVDVQFLSFGRGYDYGIDIIVSGDGSFADLRPIVENGRIVNIIIANGGIGYSQNNTEILIERRGKDAKFIANVNEWKVNQVVRNKNILNTPDEGIIAPSTNTELGLRLINFNIPKIIRKSLGDHIDEISLREEITNEHSPIVGWAYDGNPIYGPYGKIGNQIRKIDSSYAPKIEPDKRLRPDFPEGFFIKDFYYDRAIGDLDEYNGRFCTTPEYPDGVYAYFATINSRTLSSPVYPYIVAEEFKDFLIEENSIPTFTHNEMLDELKLIRNISPYFINSTFSRYPLISSVDKKYKQEFTVITTLSSGIDNIDIFSPGEGYKVNDDVVFDNKNTGGTGASAAVSRILGRELTEIETTIDIFSDVKFATRASTVVGIAQTPHNLVTGDTILISDISDTRYQYLPGIKKIIVPQNSVGIASAIPEIGLTGLTVTIYVKDTVSLLVDDFIKIENEILKIIEVIPEASQITANRLSNTSQHAVGTEIEILPTRFYFNQNDINITIPENKVTYFNSKSLIGFGTEKNNYTLYNNQNLNIPARAIYVKDHNFKTGQKVDYNVGFGGTSINVSTGPDQSTLSPLLEGIVSIINLGKDFIGLTTNISGIGTELESLYIWNDVSVTGAAHSLTTIYDNISGVVENYNLKVTTSEPHELLDGDKVKFSLIPDIVDEFSLRYDTNLRKVTTEIVEFDVNVAVSATTSEFYLPDNTFNTGDKLVYYKDIINDPPTPNSLINGLEDGSTYYIIKEKRDYIKLSSTLNDSSDGISTNILSQGTGIQGFALVNPPLKVTKGNKIRFDLSDTSLSGMDLMIYKDSKLLIELETYRYKRSSIEAGSEDATLTIITTEDYIGNTLYYNLIPLSPSIQEKYQISLDNEVNGNNQIVINKSVLTNEYPIISIGNTSFRFNLNDKPESFNYNVSSGINTVFYDTNSRNASGPVSKVRIDFPGRGYKKVPKVNSLNTDNGNGAILKTVSSSVGKIDTLQRVKDGFDYPTDPTLKPILSVPTVCQIKDIFTVGSIGIVTGGNNYNIPPTIKVIGNDDLELEANIQGGSVTKVIIEQNVNNLSGPLKVIPTRNSNGFDIDDIVYDPIQNSVTLELVNADSQIYPLITNAFGDSEINFPFEVGDAIFIENCRITDVSRTRGFLDYNSSNFNFRFFTVTGISTDNFTVTYSMNGIGLNMGEYNTDINFGYVINKKDMAEFEMIISDDLSYSSGEDVVGFDSNNKVVFSAVVTDNGWDNDINQLRLINSKGELSIGNKLLGTRSRLNGTIANVNQFNLKSTLNVTSKKVNDFRDNAGYLNDFQQRIADNNYYQKFAYALKSELPYDTWSESVRSLVHPSGYKEFSDLDIIEKASNSMKIDVGDSSLNVNVSIDSRESMYNKYNFSMVSEEDSLEDGSVERIFFPEGVDLTPFILSLTNKVVSIDDISDQFTGISSNIGGIIVGISTFKLKNRGTPLFYREFNSSDFNIVSIENNKFDLTNHNFQTGQRIYYDVQEIDIDPLGSAVTIVDINYQPPSVSLKFDSPIFTFDTDQLSFDQT
jgi:hypothetical protein